MEFIKIIIDGMIDASCIKRISELLRCNEGIDSFSLSNSTAKIMAFGTTGQEILSLIEGLGYTAKLAK